MIDCVDCSCSCVDIDANDDRPDINEDADGARDNDAIKSELGGKDGADPVSGMFIARLTAADSDGSEFVCMRIKHTHV